MNDVYVISVSVDGPKHLYVRRGASSCGCSRAKPRQLPSDARVVMTKRDKVVVNVPKHEKLFVVLRRRSGGKDISKPNVNGVSHYAFLNYEVKLKFLTELDDVPETKTGSAYLVSWGKIDKLVPHVQQNSGVIYEAYTVTDEHAFVAGNQQWKGQYTVMDDAYPSLWV